MFFNTPDPGSVYNRISSVFMALCLFPVCTLAQIRPDLTIFQPLNNYRPLEKGLNVSAPGLFL